MERGIGVDHRTQGGRGPHRAPRHSRPTAPRRPPVRPRWHRPGLPVERSATSLMNPSLPARWIQPRVELGSSVKPTPTSRPASRACCSVMPDRADLGIGEGDPRDRTVVGRWPVLAEDVASDDGGLVHRHVGEGPLAGDVTDRPQPLACAQPIVGVEHPRRRVETHGVEADIGKVVAPTGCHQQLVGGDHLVADVTANRPCRTPPTGSDPGEDPDALAPEHVRQELARLRLLQCRNWSATSTR